mgnify:CR=1 FL=1
MSVIPFVLDGSQRTIVATRGEFDDAGGIEGDVVFVHNLDEDQVRNPSGGNASYDLRVGDEYRDHRDEGKTDLGEDDFLVLKPGDAFIIETAEFVRFPRRRFGHIVPKVSLLQKGLSNTSSKIDPGYFGKLLVTVFNLGQQKVTLEKGDKFCTLYLLEVGNGVITYDGDPKRIEGRRKRRPIRKLRDSIRSNQALVAFITSVLALLGTLGGLIIQIVN